MDNKNFAIGILSTTAVILTVGLMVIHTRPEPALASGVTAAGGGYVLTVGNLSVDDEELLFLIDSPSEKMIIYAFDAAQNRTVIVDRVNLGEMRGSAGPASKSGTKKPSRRRRP